MKQALRSVIFIVGALGWWGFVYPDLCLTPQEAAPEGSKSGVSTISEDVPDEEVCKPEEIRIKSRLYEYVCQVREKG